MVADNRQFSDAELNRIIGWTALRWTNSSIDRADLFSMANEAVGRAYAQYDPSRGFKSDKGAFVVYFARLHMRNLAQQHLRKRRFGYQPRKDGGMITVVSEPYVSPDSKDAVKKVLQTFTSDDRFVLKLRMEGLTGEEIARALGCSRQAICQRLRNIKASAQRQPQAHKLQELQP